MGNWLTGRGNVIEVVKVRRVGRIWCTSTFCKMLKTKSIVLVSLVFSLVGGLSAEDGIVFIAPAESRLIRTRAQIEEPDDLRGLQIEGNLEVVATSRLYAVLHKPSKLPAPLSLKLSQEFGLIKEPGPINMNEPLIGPERTFVAFDANGDALAIVFLGWTDEIEITKCSTIGLIGEMLDDSFPPINIKGLVSSIGDLFQRESEEEKSFYDEEFSKFLRTLESPTKDARTPFRQWTVETQRNMKNWLKNREQRQAKPEKLDTAEQGGDANTDSQD